MSESTDYNPIIIEMENAPLHTEEHLFCYDSTCGCHEDPVLIAEVAQNVADGLLTPQEATDLVSGKLI